MSIPPRQPPITPTPPPDTIPVTADGTPQLYWSEDTVCKAMDIGKSLLWQRVSAGAYPHPSKLPDDQGKPGKSNRWDVRVFLRWMDAGMPHYQTWEGRKT